MGRTSHKYPFKAVGTTKGVLDNTPTIEVLKMFLFSHGSEFALGVEE